MIKIFFVILHAELHITSGIKNNNYIKNLYG
jgi:hypothetical protein